MLSTVIRLPSNASVLADHDKPWGRRVTSSLVLPVNFVFEITTQFQTSLGLNLKPLHFMNSTDSNTCGTPHYFAVIVVNEATTFLSHVVMPGDLLLKVNDIDLCGPAEIFDFDSCTRTITAAKLPRTLRFFRHNGSTSHSLNIAEIKLAMSETIVPRYKVQNSNGVTICFAIYHL